MQTHSPLPGGPLPGLSEPQRLELPMAAGERGDVVIEALLYVDLSLSSSVSLLSRLAPLMARLQREVSSSQRYLNPRARAFRRAATVPFRLKLGYHMFNLEKDASHAKFCLTGEDGRFCSFPPDEPAWLSEQVTGRHVVEETLLQLCVAEYASNHQLSDELQSSASKEKGRAVQTVDGALLWDYLGIWSKECSGQSVTPATDASGSPVRGGARQEEPQEFPRFENFSPFDKRCSLERLTGLGLPVESIVKECEQDDKAQALLQAQVDLHLTTVPLFLLNGHRCTGDVTPEAIVKTFCDVGAGRLLASSSSADAATTPWPICASPAIARSPSLQEAKEDRYAGLGNGRVAVAAHLLETYSRSSGDAATSVTGEASLPSAVPANDDGVYRLKNVAAPRRRFSVQPETDSKALHESAVPALATLPMESARVWEGTAGRIGYEEGDSLASGALQEGREAEADVSEAAAATGPPQGFPGSPDPRRQQPEPSSPETLPAFAITSPNGSSVTCVDWINVTAVLLFLFLLFRFLLGRRRAQRPPSEVPASQSSTDPRKSSKKD